MEDGGRVLGGESRRIVRQGRALSRTQFWRTSASSSWSFAWASPRSALCLFLNAPLRDQQDVRKTKEVLEVREDPNGNTFIPGLVSVKVRGARGRERWKGKRRVQNEGRAEGEHGQGGRAGGKSGRPVEQWFNRAPAVRACLLGAGQERAERDAADRKGQPQPRCAAHRNEHPLEPKPRAASAAGSGAGKALGLSHVHAWERAACLHACCWARALTSFWLTLLQVEQWLDGGRDGRVLRSKLNFVDLAGSERWNMQAEMQVRAGEELG